MMQRLWKILSTPIGPRLPADKKRRYRGAALIMVMMSLALMAGIVTDMNYNETVRYRLAIYQRDALKAEALAEGGINFGRLMVMVQGKIQPFLAQLAGTGIPLPGFTLWELIPLNSATLKDLSTGDLLGFAGIDVSEAVANRKERREAERNAAAEGFEERDTKSAFFESPEGGFGAFDGTFDLDIQDEESKISLRGWQNADQKSRNATRKLLQGLFEPERFDPLFDNRDSKKMRHYDRATVIANIFDWIDVDKSSIDPHAIDLNWGNSTSGSENSLYDGDIIPKNAYFDSLDELRLVKGFTDDHMRAFGSAISIYGEGGKINILSAKKEVIEALLYYCASSLADPLLRGSPWVGETLSKWQEYKTGGLGAVSPQGFLSFLLSRELKINRNDCQNAITDVSSNFTIKGSATVGDVKKTLSVAVRMKGNAPEEIYYFSNQ